MNNAKDFITNVFNACGIDLGENAKKILDLKGLDEIEIDDKLFKSVPKEYLTHESALSNQKIKEAIKNNAFIDVHNELDGTVKDYLKSIGIDDNEAKEILKGKKITDKINSLTKFINDKNAEKSDKTKEQETIKSLQTKMSELMSEAAKASEKHKSEINSLKESFVAEKINSSISKLFNGLDYSNKVADEQTNLMFAKIATDKLIADKKIKPILDGENLKFVNEDGTDYYEQNRVVNPFELVRANLINKGIVNGTTVKDTPAKQFNMNKTGDVVFTNGTSIADEVAAAFGQQN